MLILIALTLSTGLLLAQPAATLASSTFDNGSDGWKSSATLTWNQSGYISGSIVGASPGVNAGVNLTAPQKVINALSSSYGGSLSLQVRTEGATEVFVSITNSFDPAGGMMFHGFPASTADPINGTLTQWTNVSIPLWPGEQSYPRGWLKLGGDYLDEQYFRRTLANATALQINAYSYIKSAVRLDLDNVSVSNVPNVSLTVDPGLQPFVYVPGHAAAVQNISVSTSTPLAFSATSSAAWLTLSPASGTTPATLSVSVNPTNLGPGTYNGTITVAATGASNSPQLVSASLTVQATTSISATPSALTFSFRTGLTPPSPQSLIISASAPVGFTATAVGGSWLVVTPASGTAPVSVSVSVNPIGLVPGTYNGSISIWAPGASNSPQTVSASLTVTGAPTISISPNLLNFTGQSEGSPSQAQILVVSASSVIALTAAASGGSWLSVNPTSGTTPTSLSVSVNPTGLNPGTYNGAVKITAPSASNSPQDVTVSLVVSSNTRPTVTDNGVVNGASFAPSMSAGSWISIMGKNLSPTTRIWNSADIVNGILPTSLSGVNVNVNGKPATVYYISPTQLNVQVPDDAAIGPVSVQITTPAGIVATSAIMAQFSPGIFTGKGNYVAAVFPDGSLVGRPDIQGSSFTPAHPGDVILLYGTGFGATNPPRPTGRLIDSAPIANDFHIRIGGVPTTALYGGLVGAGLYQFNVQIPELPDGDQPVSIDVGGLQTQTGVVIPIRR